LIVSLERGQLGIKMHNIDGLRALCSEFGFAELLSALEAFDAAPPHAGVWSIEDESRRRIHDVGLLQQEVGDFRRANSRLIVEIRT
jgi:hypothetical protein